MIDPALISAVQRGDPEAFTALVTSLRPMVTAMCYGEIGDWDTAEDCAQDVFVRVHRRIDSLRSPKAFPAWLRTTVRNVCISEHRRPHRRGQSLDDLEETHPAVVEDGQRDVRERVEQSQTRARLDTLVGQLPDSQRRLLILRHFKHLSTDEIAELTDMTPASVRTVLCRARLSLRKLIESHAPDLSEVES